MEVSLLYNDFHQQLLRYVKSKIRSKEDAEDILQNVFIKIASNVDKLEDQVKVKSWMFTITRNAIIDYYRVNAKRSRIAVQEVEDDMLDMDESDTTGGLDHCIGSMIRLLPDEYRDIISQTEIQGIPQKDLAERYGMAYPSMRSRVQRGRERLRQLFLNCCHIQTDKMGNVLEVKSNQGCGGTCDSCS